MTTRRSLRPSLRALIVVCLAAGALAAVPASAPAARSMVSIMQDDNQLVYGTTQQRIVALDRMKALGVEAIRVTMLWKAVAPRSDSRRKPRRFNAADPGDYPSYLWDKFDEVVVMAQQRGLTVYMNPTGGGPRWAHRKTRDKAYQRSFRPRPSQFKQFVRAAGRRYSGNYRDENSPNVLPRVSWWAIWNEPNQPGWLTPQGQKKRGVGMIAMSPHLYRDLLVAGMQGLRDSGHRRDRVLIAELAPLGNPRPDGLRASLRPGLFLREMFCLNRKFRRFGGRAAEARGCKRKKVRRLRVLKRFPKLGFAHHPYTKKRPPRRKEPGRDALTMANIRSLPRTLDKIARRTGLLPKKIPVWLTEYGYETNPPDPFSGVSLAQQAEYINVGDYIAWKHPRIFSNAQFQLYDVPPQFQFPADNRRHWFTYQSGLYTDERNPQPKPSKDAYEFPLVVTRKRSKARIWGQARFAENGTTYPILLQERPAGSSTWVNSGDLVQVKNKRGYFRARRPTGRGSTWRAVWASSDFRRFEVSREVTVR